MAILTSFTFVRQKPKSPELRALRVRNSSNSQYELQSGEFAPFGRELSALKLILRIAGDLLQAELLNENCCIILQLFSFR